MKCYIVNQNDELKILKVQTEDEIAFKQQYQDCIVAEGNNVQEAIISFSKRIEGIDYESQNKSIQNHNTMKR